MTSSTLLKSITTLSLRSHAFSDADLEQPWRWRAHDEGVRFALLGAYHELRDLAVILAHRRAQNGPAVTRAQRALAPYHTAYRELQALLVGVPEDLYDKAPAPGEWPLRTVMNHVVATQRTFFTLVHYGLARQRSDEEQPARLPQGEVQRVADSDEAFAAVWRDGSLSDLLRYFDELHRRAILEFSDMSDDELEGPSIWWEDEPLSLQYRLHRFDAHLRQHTIQVEKTLEALGHEYTEARRLIRLLYRALAQVESILFGAPELGQDEREALAAELGERATDIETLVQQARRMAKAARDGDRDLVQQLLQENERLAHCVDEGLLSLPMTALYRGHEEIANMLATACGELDIFTAAALGRLEQVKARAGEWAGYVNEVARDGFTPLQLACYFGREETALWLMENGADVEAVAQNDQRIRPIHAAAANGNLAILRALLEHGVDVNARQQQDFTPLHTAADRGDEEMARLLMEHGANPGARDASGRTAADIAEGA